MFAFTNGYLHYMTFSEMYYTSTTFLKLYLNIATLFLLTLLCPKLLRLFLQGHC